MKDDDDREPQIRAKMKEKEGLKQRPDVLSDNILPEKTLYVSGRVFQ
jgi:hypothetical protein